MATKKQAKPEEIHQLKVTLKHFRPPIWRRILVTGDTTLDRLHQILQAAMGWTDSHLHQFKVRGKFYGVLNDDYLGWLEMLDEEKFNLNEIVKGERGKFVYEYDFGDSWEHDVVVEKILPPEPGMHYPIYIKGRRACPPEDVGGVWGYAEFLDALRDPEHPEHEGYWEWVGGEFDPEYFDLDEVNA